MATKTILAAKLEAAGKLLVGHPVRLQAESRDGAATDRAEILIYDVIGENWWTGGGVTARAIVSALAELAGTPLLVRINSRGGDVQDGTALYNAFASHDAEVTFRIDGWAASMATVLPCAGKVEAYSSTMLMIHNSSSCLCGNAKALRDAANMLEKVDGQMADIYARKSGLAAAEWSTRMDGEVDGSWLTAAEALELGLIDEIIDGEAKATALLDKSAAASLAEGEGAQLLPTASLPEGLPLPMVASLQPGLVASLPPSLRAVLGDNPLAGVVRMSGSFMAINGTIEETTGDEPTGDEPTGDEPTGDEPTGDEPTGDPVAAERERAKTIRAQAKAAGLPDMADELIELGVSALAAGKLILAAKAAMPDAISTQHGADLDNQPAAIAAGWAAAFKQAGISKSK